MPPARTLGDAPRTRLFILLGFATIATLLVRFALFDLSPNPGFHGHGYCYLWQTDLIAAHAVADGLIGLSYLAISVTLVYLVRRTRDALPYGWMFVAFGAFIVACGATHLMEVWTLWSPMFWLSADVKMVTAVASAATAIMLPPLVPRVLGLIADAQVSEERRQALARVSQELEARVLDRTAALNESLQREQALRAAAEAANRTKEEFLATVSHELRTPLNSIVGWTELLQRGDLDPERAAHGIRAISRNVRAQARVVDDLLDVARITSGKLTLDVADVSLVSVVRAALDAVRPAATARRLEVELHAPSDDVVVLGDAGRLQQVVWNLLSNAVKFTPEHGSIDVTLSRSGSHGTLEVRDTGVGIEPGFLPFVFERFTQADSSPMRSYSGLGLGLAIARHLVELHGGSIEARSDGQGRGAVFTVRLPLAARSASRGAAEARSHLPRALSGCRVLIVDDDPESRDVATAIVEAAGGMAMTAWSAADALDMLSATAFDAVVCDIGMPREDGYAFVTQLRASTRPQVRSLPAIALTGYAGPGDEHRALQAGFDLHVKKPVTPEALIEALAGFTPGPR